MMARTTVRNCKTVQWTFLSSAYWHHWPNSKVAWRSCSISRVGFYSI